MAKKAIISISPLERILRKAGAERVSPKAAMYLSRALEDIASDLALQAADVARHAKRKTIIAQDIKLVTR